MKRLLLLLLLSLIPVASANNLYLTNGTSDVATSDLDQVLSLSRGTPATTAVTGPNGTSPIQVTATNGGTAISWFSGPLQAVTLSGNMTFHFYAWESHSAANVGLQVVAYKCDYDGTVVATLATGTMTAELGTTANTLVTIPAAAISNGSLTTGQRIKVVVYGVNGSWGNMPSARNFTVGYNGPTADQAGDTYVTFSQTLTAAPAVADSLELTTAPDGGVAGQAFTTQPVVTLKDQYGGTWTSGSYTVTASVTYGPIGGSLSNATANVVNGVATFTSLTASTAGDYDIAFTATPSLATSSVVNANPVSVAAGSTRRKANRGTIID